MAKIAKRFVFLRNFSIEVANARFASSSIKPIVWPQFAGITNGKH